MPQILVSTTAAVLADRLRQWWAQESEDWDEAVEAEPDDDLPDEDLWEDMPTVDSKAIARTSPIFQEILGIALDVKFIRRGGYSTIDEAIDHLVPQMEQLAQSKGQDHE
jgi:hypothetical protein